MAGLYAVPGETLTGIADAIRSKTGSDDFLTVAAMASAIEGISGGGDAVIGSFTPDVSTQTISIPETENCKSIFIWPHDEWIGIRDDNNRSRGFCAVIDGINNLTSSTNSADTIATANLGNGLANVVAGAYDTFVGGVYKIGLPAGTNYGGYFRPIQYDFIAW